MWCCPSLSGHTTIEDVCPVLYSYCLHCGWAFHCASKGTDTVILLDLRRTTGRAAAWSFCEGLHKSHHITLDKWRGIKELSHSEWDLVNMSRTSGRWPGREEDMMPPENLQLHPNIFMSSSQGFQMTTTNSQIPTEGGEGTRVERSHCNTVFFGSDESYCGAVVVSVTQSASTFIFVMLFSDSTKKESQNKFWHTTLSKHILLHLDATQSLAPVSQHVGKTWGLAF